MIFPYQLSLIHFTIGFFFTVETWLRKFTKSCRQYDETSKILQVKRKYGTIHDRGMKERTQREIGK